MMWPLSFSNSGTEASSWQGLLGGVGCSSCPLLENKTSEVPFLTNLAGPGKPYVYSCVFTSYILCFICLLVQEEIGMKVTDELHFSHYSWQSLNLNQTFWSSLILHWKWNWLIIIVSYTVLFWFWLKFILIL